MTTLTSSSAQALQSSRSPYVTSEFVDNTWVQPSISHYTYDGTRLRQVIQGLYGVWPNALQPLVGGEQVLQTEFEMWETASDEDLAQFEAKLD